MTPYNFLFHTFVRPVSRAKACPMVMRFIYQTSAEPSRATLKKYQRITRSILREGFLNFLRFSMKQPGNYAGVAFFAQVSDGTVSRLPMTDPEATAIRLQPMVDNG